MTRNYEEVTRFIDERLKTLENDECTKLQEKKLPEKSGCSSFLAILKCMIRKIKIFVSRKKDT